MSTNTITAVVVLNGKELQVQGEIIGTNNSQLEISVTRVMILENNKDVTEFWEMFEDSFKVKNALKEAYYNSKINIATNVLRELEVAIQDAQRTLTNW